MLEKLPLLLIALFPLVGILIERFCLYYLRRITEKTPLRVDDVVIDALKFMPTLWLFLLALYILTENLTLPYKLAILAEKLILVSFIMSIALFLSRILAGFISLYMKSFREDLPATSLIVQISRVLVLLVGTIIALDKLGIAITPLLTALGVGGLAVALALRDTLENLFAGFHILATRQIRPGDYIKLQSGEEGYVEDITWRNTLLRQIPNNMIIVPNSKLSTSIIVNYHMPQPELNLVIPIGVSYESDLQKVEKVTLEVAREVQRDIESAIQDFEPKLRYTGFGAFSINFNVILRAKDYESQHLLRHEFLKRLYERYKQERIVIISTREI
ncbi:MAG: mechanosensitive ion channel family protein [Acidobacteria bacterium]|jgi:small-conductance mechanosensitive channel|nr:MAG: mechanosensitive ion channel family protein [Acidobacteriota bacterium]